MDTDRLKMNKHVKRIVVKALRRTGLALASRALHQRHVAILAYHNIVPHGESIAGDRSLHLEQYEFARQLDWLRRACDIVPLTEIFNERPARRRMRIAITFDDAYRGAVTAGVKELVDRDMPATIFVAPEFVGGKAFWWDVLAPDGNCDLSAEIRRYCLDELIGQHERIITWAREHNIAIGSVPSHQTCATEEELTLCVKSGRITLGSHTWSHPNLSRLPSSGDIEPELRRPLEWLSRRFDQVLPWLAYPYGLASADVAHIAKQAGYAAALLVSGGPIDSQKIEDHRFCLPRLNIPRGLSLDGFVLRSSGLLSS